LTKIRFIHTADLHLDSPFKGLEHAPPQIFEKVKESTFKSFEKIVDIAIQEKVDFILIAGDIFDGANRSLRAQMRFREEMNRLFKHHILVYITHGNHDHLGGNWVNLDWPSNVHFFNSEQVTYKTFMKNNQALANIYGFSYPFREVKENKVPQYEKSDDAIYHIGMLHGNAEGNGDHDPYAPFSINELLQKDFTYWALGHIHKKQILHEKPHIVYPGNIQGRHRKESGPKGCYLIEIENNYTNFSFIETAPIVWENATVSIENLHSIDELINKIEIEIDRFRHREQGVMLMLHIVGSGDLHRIINDKGIVEELILNFLGDEEMKKNFVWIVDSKIRTTEQWDREHLKKQQHFTGQLLHIIDQKDYVQEALQPLFNHRKAKKFLEKIDESLKEEIIEDAESIILNELLKKTE
jgi:DNA repair protein SbcD/Mre11